MNYVLEVLPSLLDGAKMTLQIFCLTLIGSLPLGLIVGLALISRFRLLKAILRFYVWLMRGTPLLLQLIFVFYGLPLVGLTLGRFDAALFAFILNYTAYFAEIFRGGLQSIDKGQYESAKVLRLTYWQTIRKIVTPQVVKIVLPSIGNEVINLVKDSSLVYVIGIGDLLRAGNVATSRDVTLVPLVMVGVVYLVMTAVLTFILRKLEQYYSYWK
ncbi:MULTISPECIES: amino acid ABC transporter permease [Ligilactobacillus]|uniref:Amino acid ABC transporter permease n=1 Tax=Ligilactobacillus salivarius TaxID=1624 RepID=A0AAX3X2I9_9LACO|nr:MULTISPECIES: amino acid ABC transporter permease [Ligilactobacillus]MBE7387312.1 amino acid ABC transporter permease [Ligilactobacillus salivarius]MBE7391698.1 amino acid ABC transporter permease [Ligilactobacillus salivarius]MCQ4115977.1 amino acid ABC transporter permease [Ligilactobacillus sp. MP3]PAY36630.1 amino acid ABC transporter permease [Ligilactobacillus salivarius]PAY40645.1 amino acid ABC transporter permease [Ligilactobacillus salivarius]